MTTEKTIGQTAYEAWWNAMAKAPSGPTDGIPLPMWEELHPVVKDSWLAAAQSVRDIGGTAGMAPERLAELRREFDDAAYSSDFGLANIKELLEECERLHEQDRPGLVKLDFLYAQRAITLQEYLEAKAKL